MLTKFEALGVELELVKPNVHFLRLDTKKMSEKKKNRGFVVLWLVSFVMV